MFGDILSEALRSAVLVSGLVVVMMMLIESFNIDSKGDVFSGLRRSRVGQVVISAALGAVPGCMGGFASVSLYTHGIISFGALVAMMIATAGDESFVMLAMMPGKALWIFLILFALAIVAGIVVDLVYHPRSKRSEVCEGEYVLHAEEPSDDKPSSGRHFGWKRLLMLVGVAGFIAALLCGWLEDAEDPAAADGTGPAAGGGINLLSEEWMYWLFGAFSLIVVGVLIWGRDHFVEEHLWEHIIVRHLPSVFCWTFGVLLALGIGLHFVDITSWISSNTALMILLAAAVGIIPESGPHLVFVTLFASGVVPLPVLLASCISQDGHAALPLLAESKRSFLRAKLINFALALAVGYIAMLF